MVIRFDQIPDIWRAIVKWMNIKVISPNELARLTHFPIAAIEKGIRTFVEPVSSDFIHECIEVFGLSNARNRSYEDTSELLTDNEAIQLLTDILNEEKKQGNFWD